MTNFNGTINTDNFVGGVAADNFYFTNGTLQPDDKIIGGAGGTDRLTLSGFSSVDLLGIGAYGSTGTIQGIEEIVFTSAIFSGYIPISVINSANGILWVYGSSGADFLGSTKFSDGSVQSGTMYLFGGDGNDSLFSYFGTGDALFGGEGDDTLTGENVYLDGGNGNDTFNAGKNCVVHGGNGNDNVSVQDNNLMIYGDAGDDVIRGTVSSKIEGGSGNDVIVSNLNLQILYNPTVTVPTAGYAYGGDGDDYFYAASGAILDGGNGIDTIGVRDTLSGIQISNIEILDIASATITISASTLNSFQTVKSSNGQLQSFIVNGSGIVDFAAMFNAPTQSVRAIASGSGDLVFKGTANADVFYGGLGNDTLYGAAGDDYLIVTQNEFQGGADTVYGGIGNDSFYSNGTNDSLYGGLGSDTFYASGGGIIDGGDGPDKIIVSGNFNALQISNVETIEVATNFGVNPIITMGMAQVGSFTFTGYGNQDIPIKLNLIGNGSYDFSSANFSNSVSVTLELQTAGVYLSGTTHNDTFYGSDYTDYLYGGLGDDVISGGRGADYLFGGDGNDTLNSTIGNDYMFGGVGNDRITTGYYYYDYPQLGGTSYASGGAGNDTLIALGLNDVLAGGAGDDALYSYSSEAATLLGEDGNDYFEGDAGNDFISGGAGNDVMYGGDGVDYFVGGAGTDYFIMTYDDYYGSYDIISDFTAGVDFIGLPAYLQTTALFIDTAYGLDIYYGDVNGTYQILLTGIHNTNDVLNAIYYI
jgi:Ca2+-binding RTX toxin-like protein